MRHPEALLLPAFMLADYFLTVAGANQKDKKYAQHFRSPHYELNPIWQKDIAKRKLFNPRFIVLALLLSGLIIGYIELGLVPEPTVGALLGVVLGLYGMILGRHLSNLLTFRRLISHPEEVEGQVILSHRFILALSVYQSLPVVIPVALLAFFSPTPFAIGATIGLVVGLLLHVVWLWRARNT